MWPAVTAPRQKFAAWRRRVAKARAPSWHRLYRAHVRATSAKRTRRRRRPRCSLCCCPPSCLASPPRQILRERRRHRGLRALLLTSPPRAPARAAARVSLGEGRSEGRAGGRCAAQQKRRPGLRVDSTKGRGFFCKNTAVRPIWTVRAPDRTAGNGRQRGTLAGQLLGTGFICKDVSMTVAQTNHRSSIYLKTYKMSNNKSDQI